MRKTVVEHDVAAWADKFLTELATGQHEHDKSVRPARRS